ncbi:MAG: hypothetical protein IPL65_12670 [Lewinellaceae bacterium]|nr:hypothetical protein [Lewinellaceae bacterium]
MKYAFLSLCMVCTCAVSFAQSNCQTELYCPSGTVEICDKTPNEGKFWNDPLFWDAGNQRQDLTEGPGKLQLSLYSKCASSLSIRYLLFLDLDSDGIAETVVNSVDPAPAGTVRYNNLNTPNYSGGTPATFDNRSVPSNEKYYFVQKASVFGQYVSASVRWQNAQGAVVTPQLPNGNHRIKWFVTDPNGGVQTCEYALSVRDCVPPQVGCLSGLVVSLSPAGDFTLYASDVLQFASDNLTPSNLLGIGIQKSGAGVGFPLDSLGNPLTSVTYYCDEVGADTQVELWVQDAAGNTAVCITSINILDDLGACSGGATVSVCAIQLCSGHKNRRT